ncbi:MAG: hypothetical protein KME42_22460 [Tildeniella nuda ZEHNDER 1965/U140]|jgi:serine/threonine-protein kinase|nr:hypothetical protein [Tildeniella nuda ZEHNDER 1965/U140]
MTTLMVLPWTPKPSFAATPDFPITELRWLGIHRDIQPTIRFVVPDQDTATSAYGGELRRYDIHVAKMFEVTHHFCQQDENLYGIDWFYEAAGGTVNMGRFKVTCSRAYYVMKTFGLDRLEETTVQRETLNEKDGFLTSEPKLLAVPVLNLTGKNISQWMDFVQQFRPDFSVAIANDKFPVQEVLRQINSKAKVPILLPEQTSKEASNTIYICARATARGYHVGIATVPECTTGTAIYVASISADKGGKLVSPSSYHNRFEHTQLARGIRGIATSSYGATTMSRVQWKYQGVLYEVHSKGGYDRLIKMASSAIAAGPR